MFVINIYLAYVKVIFFIFNPLSVIKILVELIYKKVKAAELREPSSAKGDQINIQRGIFSRNLSWIWKSEWMFPERKKHSKQESAVCIKASIMACVSTQSDPYTWSLNGRGVEKMEIR